MDNTALVREFAGVSLSGYRRGRILIVSNSLSGRTEWLQKCILDDVQEQIISGPSKRLVYDVDGRIQHAGYSLCLLERFQDSLRRRGIWLENSDRWCAPR